MARRLRKKNKKLLVMFGIAVFLGAILVVAYLLQTHDEYKNTEYGDIGNIEASQDDIMVSEEDKLKAEADNRETLKCLTIDCGDALSVLVDIGQTEILYDCGYAESGNDIVKKISGYVDGELDYLIVSHSHADHAGGVPAVAKAFDINTVITSGEKKGSSTQFEAAMKALKKEGCKIIEDDNMSFDVGDYAQLNIFECLDPKDDDNPNNLSVIATVTYYEKTILFTGDSEKDVEKRLKGKFSSVTLFIAGHHMSSTSNSAALINEWDPSYIVTSSKNKKESEYGFPHKEALSRCMLATSEIYGTFKSGDILFQTDGQNDSIDATPEERLELSDAS